MLEPSPHLDIVRCGQGVGALKVEEVRCAPDDTLLHSAAAPEAEVMQPRGQEGRGSPGIYALLEGRLYDIPRPPAQRGHCGGIPAQHLTPLIPRCFTMQRVLVSRASRKTTHLRAGAEMLAAVISWNDQKRVTGQGPTTS